MRKEGGEGGEEGGGKKKEGGAGKALCLRAMCCWFVLSVSLVSYVCVCDVLLILLLY